MRVRNIVFLLCAVAIVVLVGVFVAVSTRSERRLEVSLQHARDVLDIPEDAVLPTTEVPDKAPEPAPDAKATAAGWWALVEKTLRWLDESDYHELPIPNVYACQMRNLPEPPAAPADLITDIHQMVLQGRPLEDWENEPKWDEWRQYMDVLQSFPILLAEHADDVLALGDRQQAARDLLAAMEMADLLVRPGDWTSLKRRFEAYSSLQPYLETVSLPADAAAPILEHLAHADGRERLRPAIRDELMTQLALYAEWENKPYSTSVDEAGLYWGTRSWLWARSVCRPWFNQDQECYATFLARMADCAEQPFYAIAPELRQIETDIDDASVVNGAVASNLHWIASLFFAQAGHEARLDVMQMGMLLEQCFARTGAYPSSLDAIAPAMGGALPLDPVSGQPYVYEGGGDEFFLSAPGFGDGSEPAWRGRGTNTATTSPVADGTNVDQQFSLEHGTAESLP